MTSAISSWFHRLADAGAARRWHRLAQKADRAGYDELRVARQSARKLRWELDRLLHVAEGRLALPLVGGNAMPRPLHCDWAWRPQAWAGPVDPPGLAAIEPRTGFGSELTVFHDCTTSELTLRQVRNGRSTDLAPFGLRMDVLGFDGSYLSLVIDLPEASVQGLSLRHVIRMDAVIETERPIEIFARLNVRHGPNTEQVVREIPRGVSSAMIEFDLAYTRMNEKRVERAWVDLIFDNPRLNEVHLRDVTFSRRLRADV